MNLGPINLDWCSRVDYTIGSAIEPMLVHCAEIIVGRKIYWYMVHLCRMDS